MKGTYFTISHSFWQINTRLINSYAYENPNHLKCIHFDSCHAAEKICHLPMLQFPYTTLCLGLVGMDSCGLLSARTYQLANQSVPLSLWEAGCIQHAWSHAINTVTFKKTKDLQNIIRHTVHPKVKAVHCKCDGLTFSAHWKNTHSQLVFHLKCITFDIFWR